MAQSTRPLLVVMAHSNRLDEANSPRSKPASMSGNGLPQPGSIRPKRVRNRTPEVPAVTLPAVPDFAHRYGPWAIVTGAAQGVGLAFTDALLERGCSVVLVDRQPEVRRRGGGPGATARAVVADLADPAWIDAVAAAVDGLEVGLAVANAAVSFVGPLPRPAGREPPGHGGGELPGHHRAGGVGAAADGGAGPRGLHRHQLRARRWPAPRPWRPTAPARRSG